MLFLNISLAAFCYNFVILSPSSWFWVASKLDIYFLPSIAKLNLSIHRYDLFLLLNSYSSQRIEYTPFTKCDKCTHCFTYFALNVLTYMRNFCNRIIRHWHPLKCLVNFKINFILISLVWLVLISNSTSAWH